MTMALHLHLVSLVLATSITAAEAADDYSSSLYSRILHNVETGTITHPLVPHRDHLERRRRELMNQHDVNPDELDLTLPPRPHTSRHDTTTYSENNINNNNVGGGGAALR